MNGDADLVFVGAGFRLDGESDGGLGNLRWRIIDRRSFVTESFACGRFLQFGDGADVSGVKLAVFGALLALNGLDMLQALRKVAIVIRESGGIFQDTALYLEIIDAAGERVGKRLEDKEGKRLAVVVFSLDAIALAAGILEADLRVLIGMRERVGKDSKQAGVGDVVETRRHQGGKDFLVDDCLTGVGVDAVDGSRGF